MTIDLPLAVLMSAKAIDVFGERINVQLAGVPHKLIAPGSILSGEEPAGANIAFLTRDVTADSGKVKQRRH